MPSSYMAAALDEAHSALGTTSPNPAVGAVVVVNDEIIAYGRTQPVGGPHAEVMALRAAGIRARGADLYSTLEPCVHQGRTPPCVDALISAGIRSVTYAVRDPFPKVDGRGHIQLEAAGIVVHAGDGEAESRKLLAGYLKHQQTGLPLVAMKYAASLDGRIAAASGDSKWISGPEALLWSHNERVKLDAIVVGSETVIVDDPELSARPGNPAGPVDQTVQQPLRIVVDSRGRIPSTARVLQGSSPTLIATSTAASENWCRDIAATGAEIMVFDTREGVDKAYHVDLEALVEECGRRGMLEVLFEGGSALLGSLFDQRLIDRVYAIVSPIIVGAVDAPSAVAGLGAFRMANAVPVRDITITQLGNDTLFTGQPDWEMAARDNQSEAR